MAPSLPASEEGVSEDLDQKREESACLPLCLRRLQHLALWVGLVCLGLKAGYSSLSAHQVRSQKIPLYIPHSIWTRSLEQISGSGHEHPTERGGGAAAGENVTE